MKHRLSQETQTMLSKIQVSGLVSRNVTIHGRRTSIRLEPEMWDALYEIASEEKCSIHEICSAVKEIKEDETSFAAAIRVFIMLYYKTKPVSREGRRIMHSARRLVD